MVIRWEYSWKEALHHIMLPTNYRRRGFTLIELLLVFFLISVLIALATVGLLGAERYSQDQKNKATLTSIETYLNEYDSITNTYPKVDCGSVTDGFDKLGSISDLVNSMNTSVLPPLDENTFKNVLGNPNQSVYSSFGYCTSSGESAYILVLKTPSGGKCTDTLGNPFYITGNGNFLGGSYSYTYFSIPSQYNLSMIDNPINGSLSQCFN